MNKKILLLSFFVLVQQKIFICAEDPWSEPQQIVYRRPLPEKLLFDFYLASTPLKTPFLAFRACNGAIFFNWQTNKVFSAANLDLYEDAFLKEFQGQPGFPSSGRSVSFAASCPLVALRRTVVEENSKIVIFNFKENRTVGTISRPDNVRINGMNFSANGRFIAEYNGTDLSAKNNVIVHWADGSVVREFAGRTKEIVDVVLSPDGSVLAENINNELIIISCVRSGQELWSISKDKKSFGEHSVFSEIILSSCGKKIFIKERSEAGWLLKYKIENFHSKEVLYSTGVVVDKKCSVSPCFNYVALEHQEFKVDRTVRLVNVNTKKKVAELPCPKRTCGGPTFLFSACGNYFFLLHHQRVEKNLDVFAKNIASATSSSRPWWSCLCCL